MNIMENNGPFHAMILTGEEANLSSFAVFVLNKKNSQKAPHRTPKPSQIHKSDFRKRGSEN